MQTISLALFWHQHQPYYPDDLSGENLMPWVRLHGTKDYYGMALHLKEVPEFHCTINLVPSLLQQLLGYTEGGKSDRHLDVSRMPADGLSQADACYLLDNFFMASSDNMIRPYHRYWELFMQRGFSVDTAEKALSRFSERDLRDLQIWNNLTWIHPLEFTRDPDLNAFRQKGRHWSEAEKNWLLDKQLQILRQIIPLHRELAESGQVELTTTPFYHPILPLLWDKRLARQAMPHCALPKALESYHVDAQTHLKKAIDFHTKVFGQPPKGMWPSEGSVAQEIIPAIAEAGIQWIATDEEILSFSTNGWVSRDAQGYLRHPEMLYRPWRLEEQGHQLQIVFRDHGLSDLIGFHYQRSHPVTAAQDLLGKVESIGRAVENKVGDRPPLVSIILDGENCWEYYPDGGVDFLRTLYQSCAKHPVIRSTTLGEYTSKHPATDKISHLFAGSWISHNFAIWIGHHEDNTAWDLLHQTRHFLLEEQARGRHSQAELDRAWEEIYIAEGSDWFWWFGDDHSSAQDALFDQLFRKHLQNVYNVLGEPFPTQLSRPITTQERKVIHTTPKAFLKVKIDGRRTYFEWLDAGQYVSGNERGTMTLVSESLIREVYFGFDQERMLLRIDTAGKAIQDMAGLDELRLGFLEPQGFMLRILSPAGKNSQAQLLRNNEPVADAHVEFVCDAILELTLRFQDLGSQPDDHLLFYLEAFAERNSVDRAPREGAIDLVVPSADYEQIMWQA
ncbi:MAG: glycoside hydrolase family 57 protein [Planctomycetales bacterium]